MIHDGYILNEVLCFTLMSDKGIFMNIKQNPDVIIDC